MQNKGIRHRTAVLKSEQLAIRPLAPPSHCLLKTPQKSAIQMTDVTGLTCQDVVKLCHLLLKLAESYGLQQLLLDDLL